MKKILHIIILALCFIAVSVQISFAAFVVPTISADDIVTAGVAVISLCGVYVCIRMVIRVLRGEDIGGYSDDGDDLDPNNPDNYDWDPEDRKKFDGH